MASVRFTKTEDGHSIGYVVFGEGVPVIRPPMFPYHLPVSMTWQDSGNWDVYAETANCSLVLYDPRGTGQTPSSE